MAKKPAQSETVDPAWATRPRSEDRPEGEVLAEVERMLQEAGVPDIPDAQTPDDDGYSVAEWSALTAFVATRRKVAEGVADQPWIGLTTPEDAIAALHFSITRLDGLLAAPPDRVGSVAFAAFWFVCDHWQDIKKSMRRLFQDLPRPEPAIDAPRKLLPALPAQRRPLTAGVAFVDEIGAGAADLSRSKVTQFHLLNEWWQIPNRDPEERQQVERQVLALAMAVERWAENLREACPNPIDDERLEQWLSAGCQELCDARNSMAVTSAPQQPTTDPPPSAPALVQEAVPQQPADGGLLITLTQAESWMNLSKKAIRNHLKSLSPPAVREPAPPPEHRSGHAYRLQDYRRAFCASRHDEALAKLEAKAGARAHNVDKSR